MLYICFRISLYFIKPLLNKYFIVINIKFYMKTTTYPIHTKKREMFKLLGL